MVCLIDLMGRMRTMSTCKDCLHFGICKKGFPFADGKGGGWCEDFKDKTDFVNVVLCKECKHLYCCSAVDRMFYCRHHLGLKGCLNIIEENPYCSYGERKSD